MCGIAGLIYKNDGHNIGKEMTKMLQAMKHRGPDSTGFALYGATSNNQFYMRVKLSEQATYNKSRKMPEIVEERRKIILEKFKALNVELISSDSPTDYACRYVFKSSEDTKSLSDEIEDVDGVEILSLGESLELVKDLGDANEVATLYGLNNFNGSHAIGHTRMATESDVDIRSAHPYWAYPYKDIAVVHNGQLTNYWTKRRDLERKDRRFSSNCDSELIAVYLAYQLDMGLSLEEAINQSTEEFDGVYTYIVTTKNELGFAKDEMAAKPLVVMESDEVIALASEEISIQSIFEKPINTYDPYESEVKVWRK